MSKAVISIPSMGNAKIQLPHECPICHHLVVIGGPDFYNWANGYGLEAVFRCPNPDCGRLFLGFYEPANNWDGAITRMIPTLPTKMETPEVVKKISPQFVKIYIQAHEAKVNGLSEICGPGFRKAFEFLIKDYAKSKEPDEEKQKGIENTFAATVVKQFINDKRIQAVAKRALWIGNDETHYLRKWEDKDVNDLIALIQLTIHWIEMEQLSSEYTSEMPE